MADRIKSAVEPEPVTIEEGCGHLRAISSLTPPSKRECEDCVKVGIGYHLTIGRGVSGCFHNRSIVS